MAIAPLPTPRAELSASAAAIEMQALYWSNQLAMRGLVLESRVMFETASKVIELRGMINDLVEAATTER